MKILAIIPARAGSKGLKDKNILPLNGIPLLAHAINVAKESGVCDCIHLCTESEQYAEIGRQYGADVPFLRDPALATDTASSADAIKFSAMKYKEIGLEFDALLVLQPTVPLRTADDVRNVVALMEDRNANAIISVTTPEKPPQWCAALPEDGNMSIYYEKLQHLVNRQELARQYVLNGAVALVKMKYYLECDCIYKTGCYAYIMPRERSVDIDSQLDFELCEFLLSRRKSGR